MSRPLSPEVYRRRRIAVAFAVLVLLLLVLLVLRLVSGGDEPETAPKPTPSADPTTEPTAELPDGTVPVTLSAAAGACDPESVRISPTVPPDQTAGGPVRIDLAVSSTSAEPCTLEASEADLVTVIARDGSPVYDSTGCRVSLLSTPITLNPQWVTVTSVEWNGRASGATCSDAEALVGDGSYSLQLGTLGGEPGETTFTLAPAPPPPPPPAPVEPAAPPAETDQPTEPPAEAPAPPA